MNNSNQNKERESASLLNKNTSDRRLPLINGGVTLLNNNQIDYNQAQKRTNSRQKETADYFNSISTRGSNGNQEALISENLYYPINFPINHSNSSNNTTNHKPPLLIMDYPNKNNQYDYILQEMNNSKRMMKTILENHTEMQSKIIEYNKIIQDQENILRLNNIKLNEHDSKLTEILFAFNNYLKLNEKTNRIINDLSSKTEEFTNKSEFTQLKSFVYSSNKNNETKIFESFNKIDELNSKTSELKKEQELLQRYTLDKLKGFQNDIVENRITQQQNLIQLEESKEAKLNQQLDQFRGLINIVENNLQNEGLYRKNMIENLSHEMKLLMNKNDEKIFNLERNQLEGEKKLIGINKEYVSTFQELIEKNKEKYEIESKTIKSVMELNIKNLDYKFEELKKLSDSSIFETKSQILEIKNVTSQLEISLKDNEENISNRLKQNFSDVEILKTKTQTIYESLNQFMQENLSVIDKKINSKISNLDTSILNKINEMSSNWQILENQFFKTVSDVNEKFEMINKSLTEWHLKNKPLQNEKSYLSSNSDFIFLEQKIEEKIESLNKKTLETEKKIYLNLSERIDQLKKGIIEEEDNLLKEISDKLEMKIKLLKTEINNTINEGEIINEGRVQEYIFESEERIRNKLEMRINKLYEEIEKLNIKLVLNDDREDLN